MNTTDSIGTLQANELARIAAELRSLGEPDLETDDDAARLGPVTHELAVLTAFALAHPNAASEGAIGFAELPPLGELDRHRVWRTVLARRAASSRIGAPSRAPWIAMASAAGVALAVTLSLPSSPGSASGTRGMLQGLGAQAHEGLAKLPGEADGVRAEQLTLGYLERLRKETRR